MEDTISLEFTAEEKQKLAELEEQHKRIYPFRVKGHGMIVFRRPLRAEWRRYQNELMRPQVDRVVSNENMAKTLCVLGSVDSVLDDFPGMIEVFALCIANLATGENTEVAALGKDWKKPEATT